MRILVVNANTSQFVTDRVAEEARRSASSKTDIRAVTGEFGPRINYTMIVDEVRAVGKRFRPDIVLVVSA